MAERRTPTKEAPAQPHEESPQSVKTLTWREILDRLLELDERLKALEARTHEAGSTR